MKRLFSKTRINPIWAAALLLPAATLIDAFRAPVGAWREHQQQQQNWDDEIVLRAHPKYKSERQSSLFNFASALQVASTGEKRTEEEESLEGSAGETAASQAEKGKNRDTESSRTAAEGTEEETPEESAHYEGGSKTEETSAKESRAADAAPPHAEGEAETAKGTTSEEEKEEGSHLASAVSGKGSTAESVAAPGAATAAESARAAETGAQSVHEHKAAEHAAETTAEATPSGTAPVMPKPENKEESTGAVGGAAATAAAAPPADKFVMQMNFRPSMVIGRAEADRTERHVIKDKAGTSWFEVIGPKTLTVLNLKPVQGEELLHSVVATTTHP